MVRQAEALFKSMELAGQCKLDLMLVRETFEDKEAKLWYPVREEKWTATLIVVKKEIDSVVLTNGYWS